MDSISNVSAKDVDAQKILEESQTLEKALRESEERLHLAQQVARIGTFEWNIKSGVNRWTPELEAIYGLPPGSFPGTQSAWEELVHPEDRVKAVRAVGKAMKDGAFEEEWRVIWPDGSVRWLLGRAWVFRDQAGNPERLIGVNIDVTDRKLAESELHESQRRFREMFDLLPVAIYTTDAEGRLTYFNPAAVQFSGRVPELATDQWCVSWKLFHSDGTPMRHDECPMALAIKEGRIVDGIEAIAERPDGKRVWFTPYPRPLHDAEGRIVGGVNMLLDITERKQAERATGLLAAIVDCSDDAIVSKSLDGVITSWNCGAERIFGYTAGEAVGHNICLIIPQDRRDEEKGILERLRRGERIEHFETVRVRKDGTPLDISLTISPVKDATDRIVGASKIARDVTKQKQVDRALRESEERFRAIVETTPECVKLVANDGTLLHMNLSGLKMVGADSADMVIGKNVYDLIESKDRDRFRAFNERICLGEKGSLEFDIVGLRGELRHVETHATPFRSSDGVVGQLAVTRDITKRKQAEEAIKERELSARLLKLQDEERRRIARELHDGVGQLLAAMSMNASRLDAEKSNLSPDAARILEENSNLVGQVSADIRTISYLFHPPLLDEMGLQSALKWYIDGFGERSKIAAKLELSSDWERLPQDYELCLFRIAQECLTNIHRHSGSSTALVRLLRSPGEIKLEISDEGKGVNQETQSKISSGETTGVGLRGMRERIRQLGGGLEIRSNGHGTTVIATVPFQEPEQGVANKFSDDGHESVTRPPTRGQVQPSEDRV
jgi:PAS domain S-box-containing protein